MKKMSIKSYKSFALDLLKSLPKIFFKYYPLFFVGFAVILILVWGYIFYTKAYLGVLDVPEGTYKRVTVPEDQIEKVRAEIERRENVFSNVRQTNYQDPFR